MNNAEIAKELTVAYVSKMEISHSGADIKQRTKEDAERIADVYTIIFKAVSATPK